MSSEPGVIAVNDLSKAYRLFRRPSDRFRQMLSLGRRQYYKNHLALSNVSFSIHRGESVGIIGPNGSGKSTLLQLMCGTLKATHGSVSRRGKISALLELGAGFNPEFTGRENVYFQGALQGMSRHDVGSAMEEICAFADIGEYIDQPVRTYSSGMFVRLAFSIAIAVEPDILVVDEALAVGDFSFQAKCYSRIRKMSENGTAVIFVSHDLETVKALCSRAIYLHRGQVKFDGPAGDACNRFFRDLAGGDDTGGDSAPARQTPPAKRAGRGGGIADILGVELATPEGRSHCIGAGYGDTVEITVRYRVNQPVDCLTIAFHARDERQLDIAGTNTRIEGCDVLTPDTGVTRVCRFCFPNHLRSGEYEITVGLTVDRAGERIYADWWDEAARLQSRTGKRWALTSPPTTISHESAA